MGPRRPPAAGGPPRGRADGDRPAESRSEASDSKLWAVVGASQVNIRGDCQFCAEFGIDDRVTHSWGLTGNIGVRVNSKTDVGAEVFWTPFDSRIGTPIRATFVLGAVQFRPWESQGFFVKLGIGMAFTRNFVLEDRSPINQKALSVLIGAGVGVPAERADRLPAAREPARGCARGLRRG